LQFFNLHRGDSAVAEPLLKLVTSRRLVSEAAALLGTSRLRLYQTCLFVKEPGMAETNWHSDLAMAPLDTNAFITAWMPLRRLTEGDAALLFASGSHRDFALPFWRADEGMTAPRYARFTREKYSG
jgi:ectoine hydroxylase-related dioxygenase (phytanoyl-CoA dioxygenase family)